MIFDRSATENDFCDWIDAEFSWRRVELTYFETQVVNAVSKVKQTVIRSAIPILYAHWEGFVKASCVAYLDYVLSRRRNYDQLRPNYLALGLKSKLSNAEATLKGKIYVQACNTILGHLSTRAHFRSSENVDTKFNLTFDIFENILWTVGLEVRPDYIAANRTLINPLVDFRNTIAHGKAVYVDDKRYIEMHNHMIGILTLLKNDLENAVVGSLYLAIP